MKSEAQTGETVIEIDTEAMEKRLGEKISVQMKEYLEEAKKNAAEQHETKGKGIMEAFTDEEKTKHAKVVEEFQKGEMANPTKIKEQWTICIPKYSIAELAGHLRDFVWVTDVVKGKPGETVNIPYVRDLDFAHVTVKTGTFTATTGLINVLTTTLHESGAYYDAYYGDIEKIDSNMLDELNRVFAHAAVRAEDLDLVALLNTATTGNFGSFGGGTDSYTPFVGTLSSDLSLNLIVDAIAVLMRRGREVRPGECILIVRPKHWARLMKIIAGNTPLGEARADVFTRGIIEDFLGVKVVVTHYPTYWHAEQLGVSSYEHCYLLRPKRALALAPKRDILIETDKLIENRQLRIAASHTYGVAALDYTEVVPIKTGSAPGAGGG